MSRSTNAKYDPITNEVANDYIKKLYSDAKQRIGHIPNLYSYMANAPHMLEAYMKSDALFRQHAPFSVDEIETIYLSISVENGCHYCSAQHGCRSVC